MGLETVHSLNVANKMQITSKLLISTAVFTDSSIPNGGAICNVIVIRVKSAVK